MSSILPGLPQNRHGRPLRTAPARPIVRATEEATRRRLNSQPSTDPTSRERDDPRMPVAAGSPVQTTFPFVSVFGNGLNPHPTASARPPIKTAVEKKQTAYEARRDSASTAASNESSPTNTISTVSSSMTEPSPSTSPDSPPTTSPNSSFNPPAMNTKEQFSGSFSSLPGLERSDSPNKKMRNMKNLSVNTIASNRPSTSQLPKVGMVGVNPPPPPLKHAFSAPPTPGFIVPPKPPRRKPSNLGLTLTTPESSSSGSSISYPRPELMSQSPPSSQAHVRHTPGTGNSLMFSPTAAPEGGMRLPPINPPLQSAKGQPPWSLSPISNPSPIKKQTLEHVKEEPDYAAPLSQEVKSPAYPQGPVCIYDPYVFLYLEPTSIQAREFDVILNVAREVPNPFSKEAAAEATVQEVGRRMKDQAVQVAHRTADKGVQVCFDRFDRNTAEDSPIEPCTAASESSFTSALEAQLDDANDTTPNTPKATRPLPEYIHVPWDHNANVVDDLLRLCQLIDDRVSQRKRVLIHCQCGVSRSASLVVAYGIYKNQALTVQEAYDAVKNRSRWIGPNMNLIYQLSEFKSKLAKAMPTAPNPWRPLRASFTEMQPRNMKLDIPPSPRRNSSPKPGRPLASESNLSSSAPMRAYNPPDPAYPAATAGGQAFARASDEPMSAYPAERGSIGLSPLSRTIDRQAMGLASAVEAPKDNPFGFFQRPRAAVMQQEAIEEAVTPPPVAESDLQQAAIQETEPAPPAGAVASDLQQVAQQLHQDNSSAAQQLDQDNTYTAQQLDQDNSSFVGVVRSQARDSVQTLATPIGVPGSWPLDDLGSTKAPKSEEGEEERPATAGTQPQQHKPIPQPLSLRPRAPRRPAPLLQATGRTGAHLLDSIVMQQHAPSVYSDDVPPSPSILSPRAAEFTASPFHRTSAGDLAGSSVYEQGLVSPKSVDKDPRSPHHKGEAPITRNIMDML